MHRYGLALWQPWCDPPQAHTNAHTQVDENQIRLSEESLQVLVSMKHLEPPACTITFADQCKCFHMNPDNDPDHCPTVTDTKGRYVLWLASAWILFLLALIFSLLDYLWIYQRRGLHVRVEY